ncbi:MAG TPA: I78 family peptidase inhibitor [Lysobacter sp.]
MIRSSLCLALLAASLAGCSSAPPAAGGPPPTGGVCNAEGARWAIGSAVNDDVVNRILRDTGSRDARVLRPGQPATMDFRPDRVNVDVNDRGAITGLRCG